jgi:hypothetical protein
MAQATVANLTALSAKAITEAVTSFAWYNGIIMASQLDGGSITITNDFNNVGGRILIYNSYYTLGFYVAQNTFIIASDITYNNGLSLASQGSTLTTAANAAQTTDASKI